MAFERKTELGIWPHHTMCAYDEDGNMSGSVGRFVPVRPGGAVIPEEWKLQQLHEEWHNNLAAAVTLVRMR